MEIETVDDLVNDIADSLGVYGACKSEDPKGCYNENTRCCRVGFSMVMCERIRKAVENENKLKNAGL